MSLVDKIGKVISWTKNDVHDIEKFAEEKGISIRLDERKYIQERLLDKFPVLRLTNYDYSYQDKLPDIAREVKYNEYNKIIAVLENIYYNSLIKSRKVLKLNKSTGRYHMYLLKSLELRTIDIKDGSVKEQKNGKVEIELSDADYEFFERLVSFTNPETRKILDSITDKDKAEYKEWCKDSVNNKWYFVHKLKMREQVPGWVKVNRWVIEKVLRG